ncbi:MAG: hypothetical protein D3904_02990 [Candidatus Electrothrix sp. EH2]|nr:hypothetical protein [Candidatus Electrothrix sp. EH2]
MEEKGRTEYDHELGTFDLYKILQIMPREARSAYRQETEGKNIYNFHNPKGDIMVGETSKHDNSISIGNGATVHGNTIAGSTIQNSFNTVAQSSAEPALKTALEQLCRQVEQMLPDLPEEKREEVTEDLESLVKEATKEKPRQKWYELSAEGLIDAAKFCAGMAVPVTTTVKSILALLKAA